MSLKASKCQVRGVVYIAECLPCWDKVSTDRADGTVSSEFKRQLYVGETSRSLRERSEEHVIKGNKIDPGSFIAKHWRKSHPNDTTAPKFVFKVSKNTGIP